MTSRRFFGHKQIGKLKLARGRLVQLGRGKQCTWLRQVIDKVSKGGCGEQSGGCCSGIGTLSK